VGNQSWLASAHLSYEQIRTGFTPPFRIYESNAPLSPSGRARVAPSETELPDALTQPELELPLSFENGLTLLGYRLDRTTVKLGETHASKRSGE